ncbi:MAG: DUF6502 family protein [Gammaproteobacteria bacterium]
MAQPALVAESFGQSSFFMPESIKETLLDSFRQLLRPLVRIVLRNGVSYEEFAETAKIVFVEVAGQDLLKDQGKPSTSRLALLTGLPASEVDRVSKAIADQGPPSTQNLNRVGGILGAWHQDPLFTGPYGLPLELSFDIGPNSFSELVSRYANGVDPSDMLLELKRIGVVIELPGGAFKVTSRSYIPEYADAASVQFMGVALRDLAETLDANLSDEEGGYFERRVWTPIGIDLRDLQGFDTLVNQKGMEFLETLDNWLSGRESEAEKIPAESKAKVGVGVYMFSDAGRKFRED